MLERSTQGTRAVLAGAGFLAGCVALSLPAPAQEAAPPQPAPAPTLAPALLSEVRTYGPGGAEDAFVEVCNTTDQPLDLSGWSLQFLSSRGLSPGRLVTVPIAPATILAPRGHLLLAGRQYSLGAYAKPDAPLPAPIASGVRLRDAAGRAVDAVGPNAPTAEAPTAKAPIGTSPPAQGLSEGHGLPAWAFAPANSAGVRPAQFSCVRRRVDGLLRDTDDNTRDWVLASVSGTLGGRTVRLGAPGPQNIGSAQLAIAPRPAPPTRAAIGTGAPQAVTSQPVALRGTGQAAGKIGSEAGPDGSQRLSPLRDRADGGDNSSLGTLVLRYKMVNASEQTMRRFRLQVVGATSGGAATGIADVRLLRLPPALKPKPQPPASTSSPADEAGEPDEAASAASSAPTGVGKFSAAVPIVYGVLDQPPAQPRGGGFNSSLTFNAGPDGIAPGQAVELRILLGVEKLGRYRLALDGGGLRLTFNGHVQARAAQALAQSLWGSGAWSSRQQAGSRGGSRQSGSLDPAGSAAQAEQAGATGGGEPTILAAIILEGHTEDGVEDGVEAPIAEDSPLRISSSEVRGEANTIQLRFLGALDAASVPGATFEVTINGRAVQPTASASGTIGVLLRLPEGALSRGDQVVVRWDNLRDPQGRRVSGQSGPQRVP